MNGNLYIEPAISEIYFENNNWTIELANLSCDNLDNYRLACSTGESQFLTGISVEYDQVILVNQDSMQTPLFINKNGDFLKLQEQGYTGVWYDYDEVCFGYYPNSYVNPPYEGQSLVRIFDRDDTYWLCKDNIPSLGVPWVINTFGTLSGYIFDENNNPITNANIKCYYSPNFNCYWQMYSNNYGYFEKQNLFGKNYDIELVVNNNLFGFTTITLEPDSISYYEFVQGQMPSIDDENYIPEVKYPLNNYPNPFIESTTISLSATDLHGFSQINIYNIKGQLVKEFKIQNYKFKINEIEWGGKSDDGVLQPPGFYFYSLEVDGKKIKTNKMIMVR